MNCTIRDRRPYTKDLQQNATFYSTEKLWIDIGRRNAQMIRAKERCFAWVSSSVPLLLYERKDIKEREVLLYLLLSCFFAHGPNARGSDRREVRDLWVH